MLGMIFYQNPSSRGLKNAVSDGVNGTEDDVLWEEYHEENSSPSDESVDSD
jgi:hypothetical protein